MILRNEYREDLVEHINGLSGDVLTALNAAGFTKDRLLGDACLCQAWGIYQKNIEEYDLTAKQAFQDAVLAMTGVNIFETDGSVCINVPPEIITVKQIHDVEAILMKHGMDETAARTSVQEIGYVLLDQNLYPGAE